MPKGFVGVPPPGQQVEPWYPILALRAGEPLDVTFLSEELRGVWTHWVYDAVKDRQRSVGCSAHYEKCRHCGHSPKVWQGYAAVYDHRLKQKAVFAVARKGAGIIRDAAEQRGCLTMGRWQIHRESPHPQSTILLTQGLPGLIQVLPAHDIKRTICRALGLRHLAGDTFDSPADALDALSSDENGGVL